MQVHNNAAHQTLFAFNGWGIGGGRICDLGIGNYSGQHSDWTFAQNATSYTAKTLQIYVLPSTALQSLEAGGANVGKVWFTEYGFNNTGGLELEVLGAPGSPCRLDRSTNGVDWSALTTFVTTPDGTFRFSDKQVSADGCRFYRVSPIKSGAVK